MPGRQVMNISFPQVGKVITELKTMQKGLEPYVMNQYGQLGATIERYTRMLAPLGFSRESAGTLKGSVIYNKPKKKGEGFGMEVGSNLEYSLRRHEEPARMGIHDMYDGGAKFPGYYEDGRGQRTRSLRRVKGKQPGRKYLTNAIDAAQQDMRRTETNIANFVTLAKGGR